MDYQYYHQLFTSIIEDTLMRITCLEPIQRGYYIVGLIDGLVILSSAQDPEDLQVLTEVRWALQEAYAKLLGIEITNLQDRNKG
jgi:hypothetical protein